MINSAKLFEVIGERIRNIREGQTPKVSQEDLANTLGLKRTSISNIESGNQKLTLESIYEICERFGLKIHDLLPSPQEVVVPEDNSVVIGGKSHDLGIKTANLLARLRPNSPSS